MRIVVVLILSVFLASCDQLNRINVDIEAEKDVDSVGGLGSLLNTFGFDDFVSFDVSSSAEFENNDATRDNIGESYVSMFHLEVLSPDGQTLSFIDGMEVYVGDGDTRTRVAFIEDGFDTDAANFYLTVADGRDIGQYLRAESTTVEVEASGTPPDVDTRIKATIRFSIELQF